MAAEVVQFRARLTDAQLKRVRELAQAEIEAPVRSDDRSLCMDMARLVHKIDVAALLLGVRRPADNTVEWPDNISGLIPEQTCENTCPWPIDLVLLMLYRDAEELFLKAANHFPNQDPQPARKKTRQTRRSGACDQMTNLFDQLLVGGEAALDQLVKGKRQENVSLEFKNKADKSHGAFDRKDREKFAEGLSALSNSAGGLLIWGIDARRDTTTGIDAATQLAPISDIARFKSDALTLLPDTLKPANDGIRIEGVRAIGPDPRSRLSLN